MSRTMHHRRRQPTRLWTMAGIRASASDNTHAVARQAAEADDSLRALDAPQACESCLLPLHARDVARSRDGDKMICGQCHTEEVMQACLEEFALLDRLDDLDREWGTVLSTASRTSLAFLHDESDLYEARA